MSLPREWEQKVNQSGVDVAVLDGIYTALEFYQPLFREQLNAFVDYVFATYVAEDEGDKETLKELLEVFFTL